MAHLTVPTHAHIFLLHSSCAHLCVMSLLGVPSRPIRAIFSAPICSLTQPSASSTPLTGTRRSLRTSVVSDYLVSPTPHTGFYEPKFCVDASDEHTPINLLHSNRNFPHDYDATIVATTEDLDVPRHSGALSSSQHTAAANRIPTVSKLGSLGNSLTKMLADYDSVDSRNSIRETCTDQDREIVVSTVFRPE